MVTTGVGVYTPPDNIIVPFDTSTPLGQKQEAASGVTRIVDGC